MEFLKKYENAKLIKWATGYAVTNCGKILSLDRIIKINLNNKTKLVPIVGRELKATKSSHGQQKVDLVIDGKRKTCYVKNIVAEHFLSKPKGKKNLVLWHLDENKNNNAANNLEWIEWRKLCLLTKSHEYRMNLKK